jgi:hypothetical protein
LIERYRVPESSEFIVDFTPASIENLDLEGKQKAHTPGGISPFLPALNGGGHGGP